MAFIKTCNQNQAPTYFEVALKNTETATGGVP